MRLYGNNRNSVEQVPAELVRAERIALGQRYVVQFDEHGIYRKLRIIRKV